MIQEQSDINLEFFSRTQRLGSLAQRFRGGRGIQGDVVHTYEKRTWFGLTYTLIRQSSSKSVLLIDPSPYPSVEADAEAVSSTWMCMTSPFRTLVADTGCSDGARNMVLQ